MLYSDGGTPWLDLEMPARAYCGGDFVARLLNDFNDHVVPAHAPRGPRQTSTTSAPCPRPRGAHARTCAPRQRLVRHDQDPVPRPRDTRLRDTRLRACRGGTLEANLPVSRPTSSP